MVLLIKKYLQVHNFIFEDLADSRTSSWPMMKSPYPLLAFLIAFVYFVNKLGPEYMQNRKSFKLKKIMIFYNLIQICACSYMLWRSFTLAWGGKYRLICEPIDFSNNQHAIEVAKTVYMYFVLKLIDLLDTIFFVLRKKQGHISFLHVYHHTGMVALTWSAVKFVPGGHGTSLGVINCVVHIIMYSYYLLTIVDPKYKKSIWWKKHLTQLQLVQFLMLVLHYGVLLLKPDCEYPYWIGFVMVPQNLFMFILFLDFYIKTYVRGASKTLKVVKNGTMTNGHDDLHVE